MNGRVNLLVASEVDSRKKLVALLDTHTLVNEFAWVDSLCLRAYMHGLYYTWHGTLPFYSLNKDFIQPAYGKHSMALLAPRLPRHFWGKLQLW